MKAKLVRPHLYSGLPQASGLVALEEALCGLYGFGDLSRGRWDELHPGVVPEGRQSRSGVRDSG